MTDYKEEQLNEIEALESIYPEELTIISTEPHCFQVTVSSQSEELSVEHATCVLQFTYTATYPDVAPLIEVAASSNLEDDACETLLSQLGELVEENLGMVMVFTLVSAAQEKLTDIVEQIAQEKVEAKEAKEREKLEAEQKRFEGTRVTIETFLTWKAAFDAELAAIAAKRGKVKENTKLSGKELFMTDSTLDDSDVKFLEEEGDAVQVDESLFQDLEDLDLDEELDFDDELAAES